MISGSQLDCAGVSPWPSSSDVGASLVVPCWRWIHLLSIPFWRGVMRWILAKALDHACVPSRLSPFYYLSPLSIVRFWHSWFLLVSNSSLVGTGRWFLIDRQLDYAGVLPWLPFPLTSRHHLLFHVDLGFISVAWLCEKGSCDGFWLKHWTMHVFRLDCLPFIISLLSLIIRLSYSRHFFSAFDSVSAFCFCRPPISSFYVRVVSVYWFPVYRSRIYRSTFPVPIPYRLRFQSFIYSLFHLVSVATSL